MKIKLNPDLHMFDLPDQWQEIAKATYPTEEEFYNLPFPSSDRSGFRLTWAHYPSDRHCLEINETLITHTSGDGGAHEGIGINLIPVLLKYGVLIYEEAEA